ncbi:ISL3 family transposase [bacterium]|nr:ISL3 family transposase [bacterium]
MDFREIIISFLGVQDVVIEDVKRFKKDLRIEIKIRQKRSECFCGRCGLQMDNVKEWMLRELTAPPLGIYQKVKLKFMQMRGFCDACNRTSVATVDWIHPRFESMTCGFAEVAGRLMEEITCEAVSRILHSSSKLMWSLDQHRMDVMLQYLKLPKELDVSYLAADEVHFRTVEVKNRSGLFAKRWRPEFVTNLVAPLAGKVLFNAMGRDSMALTTAMSVLSVGQKMTVEKFAVDMHEAFISVIKKECPNAEICIDRFHLVQKVNEAFDKVRKFEFKKAKETKNTFNENMLEPHRRFILVARDKDLSKSEKKLLDKLRETNKSIHTAMLLVEYFHKALDKTSVKAFRQTLTTWYIVVRESKLKPFIKFAKTIRRYRENIEAYIKSRLTTAVAEGLNNKIKVLKRMGYGYSNPTSFCRKILQRCGYLNHLSINTDDFFYRWPNPA